MRALVAAAVGLIALHAVVDSFVAPQPGTSAADHLSAGLVPLACLAAAAYLCRRARAGVRALLLGVGGALALVGLALGAADRLHRTADWTALLLGPAAAVLLTAAIRTAWRARRPGTVRRALEAAGVLLVAYWFVVPVAMALVATHRPRQAVAIGPPFHAVHIWTSDGLRLAGAYAPSRNGAAVLSFPTRGGKLGQARMLVRHGYGVLLLDMRGYDGSEGSPNAFGWGSAKDVDAAVAWLQRRPDVDGRRVGGIGFSVGAEQLLEAAAGNHALRAVVADGAGERSVRETVLRGLPAAVAIPEAAMQTAALAVLSQSAPPPSLRDLARRISPGAVLFIQAGRGSGGEDLDPVYFRAARAPKGLWRVPEAQHTGSFAAHPAQYERHVIAFLDRSLRVPSRP